MCLQLSRGKMDCDLVNLTLKVELLLENLNPGVGNRPVVTYAHLSQVHRIA